MSQAMTLTTIPTEMLHAILAEVDYDSLNSLAKASQQLAVLVNSYRESRRQAIYASENPETSSYDKVHSYCEKLSLDCYSCFRQLPREQYSTSRLLGANRRRMTEDPGSKKQISLNPPFTVDQARTWSQICLYCSRPDLTNGPTTIAHPSFYDITIARRGVIDPLALHRLRVQAHRNHAVFIACAVCKETTQLETPRTFSRRISELNAVACYGMCYRCFRNNDDGRRPAAFRGNVWRSIEFYGNDTDTEIHACEAMPRFFSGNCATCSIWRTRGNGAFTDVINAAEWCTCSDDDLDRGNSNFFSNAMRTLQV